MNSHLIKRIKQGDPRALSKAITLVESSRQDHRDEADEILTALHGHGGKSIRIGVTGIPGVGKSTFIEALGLFLISRGKKVAVLAVDPSSPISGGSILGDKTRMEDLSRHPSAFVRPSPSGGALGGVARRTREVTLLMDGAGYDIVLIETVGVGQSEYVVASMVDIFVTLQMPSTGDELQSIKKGILELADLIVVNKSDGDLRAAAKISKGNHEKALHLTKKKDDWVSPVILCSSIARSGIDEIWREIEKFLNYQNTSGGFVGKRMEQAVDWFDQECQQNFMDLVRKVPEWASKLENSRELVKKGHLIPSVTARKVISDILSLR